MGWSNPTGGGWGGHGWSLPVSLPLDPLTISLVPSSDSGSSDTDNITNVTNPAFDITPGSGFQVGDVFTAYDNGSQIASGTVTQSGYNILSLYMSATSLAQGVHAIQYKQTRGSSQSPLSNTWTLTVRTTAPVLSSPTAVQDGTTWSTADLGVTTNGSDGTLYWVFPTDGTQPTAAQIIAGQDATGAALPSTQFGSVAVSSSGTKSYNATSLANESTYTAFGVHVDIAGNVSNIVAASPLTIVQPLTISGSAASPAIVNTTYPTSTFTASGGTGPYTLTQTAGTLPTGLTFTDNGNGTATISGTPTVVEDETGIVITAKDSTSTQKSTPAFAIDIIAQSSLLNNLLAYWKFDEGSGTTAADSSGNGNTVTLVNGPTWTTGIIGDAVNYASVSSQYGSISSAINLFSTAGSPFSLAGWFKLDAGATAGNIIVANINGTCYSVVSIAASKLNGNLYNGGLNTITSGTLSAGWHHFAFTFDPTDHETLYLDGVSQGSGADSTYLAFTSQLFIASAVAGIGDEGYFDGLIDEVGIWSRALTSAEVSQLYNSGAGLQYPF